jgi:hypothetical protein
MGVFKHRFTQADSLVFLYAKGSPLLAKYLEMNGMKNVQVWPHHNEAGAVVALMGEGSAGFPEDPSPSLTQARALAYAIADHTGLQLVDEDEQADKIVIHWSNGKQTVSRNLAGLVRTFGRYIVDSITVDGTRVQFRFQSVRGDVFGYCDTSFADKMVLLTWLQARRNLKGAPITIDGESGTL